MAKSRLFVHTFSWWQKWRYSVSVGSIHSQCILWYKILVQWENHLVSFRVCLKRVCTVFCSIYVSIQGIFGYCAEERSTQVYPVPDNLMKRKAKLLS
jgi:hypothetical protein